jgi:hypothetical protein
MSDDVIIVMHVLWDRFTKEKPDTFLSKYIHSLSPQMDNEIMWNDDDKELFEKFSLMTYELGSDSTLDEKYEAVNERLKDFEGLDPRILEKDHFLWACAHYKSRNHSFAVAEWKKMLNAPIQAMDFMENTHVMLPMFDLMNHDPLPGGAR